MDTSTTRRQRALALLCLLFLAPGLALAQREGTVHVVDWPASAGVDDGLHEYEFLPSFDTLSIGYRYDAADAGPRFDLTLEWTPGAYGYVRGRRVEAGALPDDVRLVALAFRADVYTGGERVAELIVSVDSMRLGPRPDYARVELADLTWDALFVETDAETARRIVAQGFELRGAEVVQAAFAAPDAAAPDDTAEPRVAGRRPPERVVVYDRHVFVDVFFDLAWLFGGPAPVYYPVPPEAPDAHDAPRGDRSGRGALVTGSRGRHRSDRSGTGDAADGRRSRGGDKAFDAADGLAKAAGKDDDEDDDDNDLLPAALTAAAAVGFIAYAGGTVGYFGTSDAPIGLSSGFVRGRWGMLLQAAVNESLVTGGSDPRHLVVKLLGFGGAGRSRVQPALGAGILATERGDEVTLEPSVSLGAAGLFGPLLLHAAYDVTQNGVELGAALNFRSDVFRRKR